MIIFANESVFPVLMATPDRYFMLNLFNKIDLGRKLTKLFPPNELLQYAPYDSDQFTEVYQAYVENNQEAFKDFMEIMMAHYYNTDVIVLTDLSSPVIFPIMETIMKIIQKRYGYLCYIVTELQDLFHCKESDMSIEGAINFLRDKEWFIKETVDPKKVLETMEISAGELSDKYI